MTLSAHCKGESNNYSWLDLVNAAGEGRDEDELEVSYLYTDFAISRNSWSDAGGMYAGLSNVKYKPCAFGGPCSVLLSFIYLPP